MSTEITIEQALQALASHPDYRVIQAVQSPNYERPDDQEGDLVTCVLIDCEATDKEASTAQAVELGMIKVAFSPTDPSRIFAIDKLSMLNEPSIPCMPEAEAVHGITADDLKGQRFDQKAIEEFLQGVDFCVAHNAAYDRPVLSRSVPALINQKWLCSMKEVNWSSLGITSRALDYLLYKAGNFHAGHRALADCEALFAVLSHPYLGGLPPLLVMEEAKNDTTWTLLCVGAPFDAKDIMKKRGYRWNPGEQQNDIPVKCWSTPELNGKERLLEELKWLSTEVYKRDNTNLIALPMNAKVRYAEDALRIAYDNRKNIVIGSAIEKLERDLGLATTAPQSAPVMRA